VPSLLLLIVFFLWLWSHGAIIIIVGHVSFMVVVIWCHHYCWSCFFCGHVRLVPLLLLLIVLPSWSWSFGAIVNYFYSCFFLGHVCLELSNDVDGPFLKVFLLVIAIHVSFMVVFT